MLAPHLHHSDKKIIGCGAWKLPIDGIFAECSTRLPSDAKFWLLCWVLPIQGFFMSAPHLHHSDKKIPFVKLGAVVLFNEFREFREFREFSEFSKLGCIRRSHPKLSKFPIFRNQCLLSFRQFVSSSFCRIIFTTDSFIIYI